ncbi:MAG TPA: XdhC family protein [Anaerolineaceae bacterium]|nr:XdhC family protein [Anaerolineaceae bacterium]
MVSFYSAVAELENNGEAGAVCIIIESHGSTPRHEGSKMLVYSDGRIIGTVGGGEVESRVIKEALESISDCKSRLLHYNMSNPQAGDPGVCGGQLEVFVEPIVSRPLVVIIGGGHVGKAVVHLAHWLGFRVAVSDDRPEFCNPQANPDADYFYICTMADLPKTMKITPSTYLILTTRGVAVDVPGLPALLESPAGFIGVIGSKRRWSVTRNGLIEKGISEELIKKVHSPIGLELNAETPEEIGVSIMAEIIMLRNGGTGKVMS